MAVRTHSLFDREILAQAMVDSLKKLNPLSLLKNPVIIITEVGAAFTTIGLFFWSGNAPFGFVLQVALWLWFTVLFANLLKPWLKEGVKLKLRPFERRALRAWPID